eukprot:scaffold3350_cov268-Pinguiococcus_pyrenoidosus.AAC.5
MTVTACKLFQTPYQAIVAEANAIHLVRFELLGQLRVDVDGLFVRILVQSHLHGRYVVVLHVHDLRLLRSFRARPRLPVLDVVVGNIHDLYAFTNRWRRAVLRPSFAVRADFRALRRRLRGRGAAFLALPAAPNRRSAGVAKEALNALRVETSRLHTDKRGRKGTSARDPGRRLRDPEGAGLRQASQSRRSGEKDGWVAFNAEARRSLRPQSLRISQRREQKSFGGLFVFARFCK